MLRPVYLQTGDRVALLSPSGYTTPEMVEKAETLLESWGFVPVRTPHLLSRYGSLAGNLQERTEDWQAVLNDDDICAIWCMTGDYGAFPLLEGGDYSIFQGNPKWLIGMGDICVLHSKLNALGIESLYACMPDNECPDAFMHLRDFLMGFVSSYLIAPHQLNRVGYAEAEIVGGMLNWIQALQGTPMEYARGSILFIEEYGKELSMVERNILSLKYAGALTHLQGLIVGNMEGKEPDYKEQAYRIIRDAVEEYNYPVCFGFPGGSSTVHRPLFLGTNSVFTVREEKATICFT